MSYRKGANFERKVRDKLKDMGAFVVRSAGSKGVFDLIAIFEDGRVWGVQCKMSFRISNEEIRKMVEIGEKYPIEPMLATKLDRKIVFIDVREIEKYKYQKVRNSNRW